MAHLSADALRLDRLAGRVWPLRHVDVDGDDLEFVILLVDH